MLRLAIDAERRRPILSTVTGGMSGAAVKPIALRMVWQVAKAVKIPVIGLGGIMNWKDAVEFMLAGASAIQIGTANFLFTSVNLLSQHIRTQSTGPFQRLLQLPFLNLGLMSGK